MVDGHSSGNPGTDNNYGDCLDSRWPQETVAGARFV